MLSYVPKQIAYLWLGEHVQKLNVWICYRMDRFFVLDMKLCVDGLFPRIDIVIDK